MRIACFARVGCVATLSAVMFACDNESSTPAPPPAPTAAPASEPAQVGAPTALLIEPGVGAGEVRFGMSVDQMRQSLGKPERTLGSRVHEYLSKGMAVVLSRQSDVYALMFGDLSGKDSPLITRCKYRTKEGIGMGSTEQHIASAYGSPSAQTTTMQGTSSFLTLTYDAQHARFTLLDGRVVHMEFRQPR